MRICNPQNIKVVKSTLRSMDSKIFIICYKIISPMHIFVQNHNYEKIYQQIFLSKNTLSGREC